MRGYVLRFGVALGGFLIFLGIMMLGVFAMIFLDFVDVSALENQEYRMLTLGVFLAVGVFDLVSGIILRRK